MRFEVWPQFWPFTGLDYVGIMDFAARKSTVFGQKSTEKHSKWGKRLLLLSLGRRCRRFEPCHSDHHVWLISLPRLVSHSSFLSQFYGDNKQKSNNSAAVAGESMPATAAFSILSFDKCYKQKSWSTLIHFLPSKQCRHHVFYEPHPILILLRFHHHIPPTFCYSVLLIYCRPT